MCKTWERGGKSFAQNFDLPDEGFRPLDVGIHIVVTFPHKAVLFAESGRFVASGCTFVN